MTQLHDDLVALRDEWRSYGSPIFAAAADRLDEILNRTQEERSDFAFTGDATHPDQRDYMATNILANIDKLPQDGDWWFLLRDWAKANSTGRIRSNVEQRASLPASERSESEATQ